MGCSGDGETFGGFLRTGRQWSFGSADFTLDLCVADEEGCPFIDDGLRFGRELEGDFCGASERCFGRHFERWFERRSGCW